MGSEHFEFLNHLYLDWDPNNPNDMVVSTSLKDVLGFDEKEQQNLYKSIRSRIHPEDLKQLDKMIKDYIEGKIDKYEQMVRYTNKSGEILYFISKGNLVNNRMICVNIDVTDLKNTGTFDLMSEKFFKFLDLTSDGFWEWDLLNPEYEYYSPRFKQMLGYEDDELENIPETWRKLIHPDDLKIAMENFEKHKNDPNYIYYQKVRYKHKSGKEINIICRGSIIRDNNNNPISMIGSHTDITDIVKKESELMLQRDRALNSSNSTKLFLANMSHEIRTPMNSIVVLSNLMMGDESLKEKYKDYLNCITSSANILLALLDDILEYSKLETLNLSLNYTNIKTDELKKSIFNSWFEKMKDKELKFVVYMSKSVPKSVNIDEQRFLQLINILISNAYKYTNSGKVTVKISSKEHKLHITVKDTGIGISKENQKKIFQPFVRVNNNEVKGSGIGLSIFDTLVKKIGGTISVKSTVDVGSTFNFTFPYSESIKVEKPIVTKRRASCDNTIHVLVVDDNKVNQYILGEVFSTNYPYIKVEYANSGEECIEKVKKNLYDIIFMDIIMPPGMNGIETTKIVKEIDPNIYVVAQTANAISGDKEKYMKITDDYISKPIIPSKLKTVINKYKKLRL